MTEAEREAKKNVRLLKIEQEARICLQAFEDMHAHVELYGIMPIESTVRVDRLLHSIIADALTARA